MNWAHSSLSEVWCIISSPIRVQTFTWLLRDSDWSILDKVFCKSRKGRLTDTDLRYHVSPAFTRNMPSLNLKTGKGQMTVCVFLIHRLCKSIVIQNNVSRFLEFVSEMSCWNWSEWSDKSPPHCQDTVPGVLTSGQWEPRVLVSPVVSKHTMLPLVSPTGQQYTRCTLRTI